MNLSPIYAAEKGIKMVFGIIFPIVSAGTYCQWWDDECDIYDMIWMSIGLICEAIVFIYLIFEFYTAYSFSTLLINKLLSRDGSFIPYQEISRERNGEVAFDGSIVSVMDTNDNCLTRLSIGMESEDDPWEDKKGIFGRKIRWLDPHFHFTSLWPWNIPVMKTSV
jgi:hypothetical protein